MEDIYSNKIPVFSIVSTKSGAGKTTLIEGIIKELKIKNYKVGILKHDVKKFEIDHPGKDSYRFTEAGADSVIIDSASKLALIQNLDKEKSIDEILHCFKNEDIIIIEGFKNNSYPKIEVHRKETDSNLLCKSSQVYYSNIIAVASDEILDVDIPVLNIDNTVEISEFIEKTFLQAKKLQNVPNMILIGSTARNSGKTALATSIINKYRSNNNIIALKVTTIAEKNGKCIRGGEGCGICSSLKGNFELTEELNAAGNKDTSLLLAAGAKKVYWLKVMKSHMDIGFKTFISLVPANSLIVCESNSLRKFVKPGVFVMLKTPGDNKIKDSAAEVMSQADIIYENSLEDDFACLIDEIFTEGLDVDRNPKVGT
jgi:molybdopterin-guanine dinucleotide biosynthesis protein MobB